MPDPQTAPTSLSPPPCHLQTPSTVSNIPTSKIQAGAVTASESQSESDQTANNVLSDSLCSICLSRLTIAGEQVGQFFDCKEEADILQVDKAIWAGVMDEDIEGTVKLSSEENDIKLCPTCHLSYFGPGYIAFCPHSRVVRYLLQRIVEEDDNRTFGEILDGVEITGEPESVLPFLGLYHLVRVHNGPLPPLLVHLPPRSHLRGETRILGRSMGDLHKNPSNAQTYRIFDAQKNTTSPSNNGSPSYHNNTQAAPINLGGFDPEAEAFESLVLKASPHSNPSDGTDFQHRLWRLSNPAGLILSHLWYRLTSDPGVRNHALDLGMPTELVALVVQLFHRRVMQKSLATFQSGGGGSNGGGGDSGGGGGDNDDGLEEFFEEAVDASGPVVVRRRDPSGRNIDGESEIDELDESDKSSRSPTPMGGEIVVVKTETPTTEFIPGAEVVLRTAKASSSGIQTRTEGMVNPRAEYPYVVSGHISSPHEPYRGRPNVLESGGPILVEKSARTPSKYGPDSEWPGDPEGLEVIPSGLVPDSIHPISTHPGIQSPPLVQSEVPPIPTRRTYQFPGFIHSPVDNPICVVLPTSPEYSFPWTPHLLPMDPTRVPILPKTRDRHRLLFGYILDETAIQLRGAQECFAMDDEGRYHAMSRFHMILEWTCGIATEKDIHLAMLGPKYESAPCVCLAQNLNEEMMRVDWEKLEKLKRVLGTREEPRWYRYAWKLFHNDDE